MGGSQAKKGRVMEYILYPKTFSAKTMSEKRVLLGKNSNLARQWKKSLPGILNLLRKSGDKSSGLSGVTLRAKREVK